MASKDPFAGQRLDQRLFGAGPPAPTPTPPRATPSKPPPSSPSPSNPSPEPKPKRVEDLKPASLTAPRFDLDDEALYKASFLFTQPELEALEDLKLELRRQLDTKVTKNDLIRSALQMLVEDYAANGGRSYATRKIRKRG